MFLASFAADREFPAGVGARRVPVPLSVFREDGEAARLQSLDALDSRRLRAAGADFDLLCGSSRWVSPGRPEAGDPLPEGPGALLWGERVPRGPGGLIAAKLAESKGKGLTRRKL
jgi:hypothetical protein